MVLDHNRNPFRSFAVSVLDHIQPNQITQIQSGVEKSSFGPFWASLGKLGQAHGQISHHHHCIPYHRIRIRIWIGIRIRKTAPPNADNAVAGLIQY